LTSDEHPPIANPKGHQERHWYPYYAGYSEEFVQSALKRAAAAARSRRLRVLDPWNGSGTTTAAANALGCDAIGYDLNPAMVVVAKARLLDRGVLASVPAILDEILAESVAIERALNPDADGLLAWFSPASARTVRSIERGIQRVLVKHDRAEDMTEPHQVDALSTLAAFCYASLFRAVRGALAPFYSTNPTWIKHASSPKRRLRPLRSTIEASLRESANAFASRLRWPGADGTTTVRLADSSNLPDGSATVDLVVTSPPYCTRIDYAVATKAELAVLGYSAGKFKDLRTALLGSTLTRRSKGKAATPGQEAWGPCCGRFLRHVANHPSKASSTYYSAGFRQYFAGLWSSIGELERVLQPGGAAYLVVQDSSYKGYRADLQQIVTEMSSAKALTLAHRVDFRHTTRAAANPRSMKYRSVADATESVLVLRKGSAN